MANGQLQALGTLAELRAAADLPLRVRLQPSTGADAAALERWLGSLPGDGVAPRRDPRDDSLVLHAPRAAKRALMRQVLAAPELIADLQIEEPTLEDMFFGAPAGSDSPRAASVMGVTA